MKKILIKYTVELDPFEFDRFLRKTRIGKNACHNLFKDDFIKAGETALRKRLQEV